MEFFQRISIASHCRKKFLQAKNPVSSVESAVENSAVSVANVKPETKIETVQVVEKQENFAKPDLAGFKPNEKLSQFLSEGDLSKIRSYLMSMLNNRRLSLEELFKSIWYVHHHRIEVFEAEENAFVQAMDNNNEANWNSDYFNLQQVYLNKNFSLARLLYLANVRETLMKRGDSQFQQIKVEKATTTASSTQQASHMEASATQQTSSQTQQSSSQQQSQVRSTYQEGQSKPETLYSPEENSFVKTVMMVGGAVLAVAAVLFAVFK